LAIKVVVAVASGGPGAGQVLTEAGASASADGRTRFHAADQLTSSGFTSAHFVACPHVSGLVTGT
jgi:hypothetical protein